MIWASTTARLQLAPEGLEAEQTLKAPTVLYLDRCWQWSPNVSVACQDEIPVDPAGDLRNRPVRNAIPYYAVVGAASLFTTGDLTVYSMRLAHIAVTAAILTLGIWAMSARRPTPGSIAMATVAFTPMAAFLFGTVNPSGVAIAAGFALWAAGLFIVGSGRATSRVVVGLAVPTVVFLIVRRDAIVWLVPILAILTFHYGPGRLLDSIRRPAIGNVLRRPVVRAALFATPVLAVGALLLGGDDLVRIVRDQTGNELAGTASSALGILPYYVNEMIGQLGWVDVSMPEPVLMAWYGLIGLAIVASVGASRRDGLSVLGVVGFVLAIPYAFGVLYRYRYFQGRYGLPLAIGIPLIASAALTARHARMLFNARMARCVVWVVAVVSSVAFAVALRRFTVGDRGPWNDMLFDPAWAPPLPTYVLISIYGALMAGLAVGLCRMIRHYDVLPPGADGIQPVVS